MFDARKFAEARLDLRPLVKLGTVVKEVPAERRLDERGRHERAE
jgi:hypothetical protein